MEIDRLQQLALVYVATGLRVAQRALELVDAPERVTLDRLEEVADAYSRMEVSTVALLHEAGVSWEAMANQVDVTRQSLHRRLRLEVQEFNSELRPRRKLEEDSMAMLILLRNQVSDLMDAADLHLSADRILRALSHEQRTRSQRSIPERQYRAANPSRDTTENI